MSTGESGFWLDTQAPPFFLISTRPAIKSPAHSSLGASYWWFTHSHYNHLFCNKCLRSQFHPFYDHSFLSTLINNKSAANYKKKNRGHKERRTRTPPPITTSPAPSLNVSFGCAQSFIYKLRLFPQRQVSLRGELYSNRCPELQRHSHRSPGDCNPPTITTTTSSSPLSILTPPSSHPHPHPHQSR